MVSNNKTRLAVIGTGITGLSVAHYLDKTKYDVTIISNSANFGGLGGSTKVNNVPVEKFYHHFFTSDVDLIELARNLNIENKINYYPSSVGFYINRKLLPFTSPLDLLKFTPISFFDRLKMGLITIFFTQKKSWRDLEGYSCKEYFSKIKADKLYEIIWKPLLKLKFGASEPNIPATFLWGRINPRGRSRKGMGEQLAYFKNGFSVLFESLKNSVVNQKVKIITEDVLILKDTKTQVSVKTNKNTYNFDAVIFTGSNPTLKNIFPKLPKTISRNIDKIKYQAVNCLLLETNKKISPYYWLNIVDPRICFGGFIEHTNLVPKTNYKNHLIYIFNYLNEKDPIYTTPPEQLKEKYLNNVKTIFPDFNTSNVVSWQLFRNPYATPIYDANYSKKIPPHKISRNIYLANTSQVYPEDRNISNGIKLAKKLINIYF